MGPYSVSQLCMSKVIHSDQTSADQRCRIVLKTTGNLAKFAKWLVCFFLMFSLGVFHNHNPLNLDSSDQQIRLSCDLNLNQDYESIDLALKEIAFHNFS